MPKATHARTLEKNQVFAASRRKLQGVCASTCILPDCSHGHVHGLTRLWSQIWRAADEPDHHDLDEYAEMPGLHTEAQVMLRLANRAAEVISCD